MDMAQWCAQITLATLEHPHAEGVLRFLLNDLVQRTDNEDARVLIQTAMDCVMEEQPPKVLEALLRHLVPTPRRHESTLLANPSTPQKKPATIPNDVHENTLETFRSATRLAATALSMASKTPEAHAFAYGLEIFMRQLRSEGSQTSQLVGIALHYLRGHLPRQELESHVQAASRTLHELRHAAKASELNIGREKS